MTYYWKMQKYQSDDIKDSMSDDSLISSTNSTIFQKNISFDSKIIYPNGLSHNTETSKVSKKPIHMPFTQRISIKY
jgi:hypothetical protein